MNKIIYKDVLNDWLENHVRFHVKERTYNCYTNTCNLHIIPSLGKMQIKSLTPTVLQNFVNNQIMYGNLKTNASLSANSVLCIIAVLKLSMDYAVDHHLIPMNYALQIKKPYSSKKKIECFTKKEQEKIEKYVLESPKSKLFGIILCLYSGIRIGELLALTWEDIDFTNSILHISKNTYLLKENNHYKRKIGTPKTLSSNRVIPLSREMIYYLKKLKKQSSSIYLISHPTGDPIAIRSYQRTFELVLKKINVPHKGFHSLRHTFATRALEQGIDVKAVSEILGHKNAIITLNCYAHSLLSYKFEMMNKMTKGLKERFI